MTLSVPALHPERTDDPRLLRWLIGSRQLPGCPPQLTALIDEGVLERAEISAGEVHTWLGVDRSWTHDGPRVRSALLAALSAPNSGENLSTEETLRRIADLVERAVAPTAASHGGDVTVRSLCDGVLTVEFHGACRGCTGRGRTLSELITTTVRAHFPQVREVRAAQPRRRWLAMPVRRAD
ncbi:NifU family protein [Mycolicibacterium sp. CBM1]